MAGIFNPPPPNVKKESRYIMYNYNLNDPAENLFNGGDVNSVYTGVFIGTYVRNNYPVCQWFATGNYLDIEFLEDTTIWEYGHTGNELAIYKNTNGVKTDFVTNLVKNNNPNTWVKIAELPKGRYYIEKTATNGIRVAYEWYLESITPPKMTLKNPTTNQHYSLAEKTLIPLPDASDKNIILHGIEEGEEIKLDNEFDKINYPVEGILNSTIKTMVKPLSIKFK